MTGVGNDVDDGRCFLPKIGDAVGELTISSAAIAWKPDDSVLAFESATVGESGVVVVGDRGALPPHWVMNERTVTRREARGLSSAEFGSMRRSVRTSWTGHDDVMRFEM